MTTSDTLDCVLVQWGDRLFYPSNRSKKTRTPILTGLALHQRAHALRQRIHATVVRRTPQVMVKVTGGGRGMGAIAAHLRYIAKGGRLPFEDDRGVTRDGKDALRAVVDQWRLARSRIPELSDRREAFNIMLPRAPDQTTSCGPRVNSPRSSWQTTATSWCCTRIRPTHMCTWPCAPKAATASG